MDEKNQKLSNRKFELEQKLLRQKKEGEVLNEKLQELNLKLQNVNESKQEIEKNQQKIMKHKLVTSNI